MDRWTNTGYLRRSPGIHPHPLDATARSTNGGTPTGARRPVIALTPKQLRRRAASLAEKRARRKRAKISGRQPARDEDYRRWNGALPCIVCSLPNRGQQQYPTEAAHVGDRGLRQKSSDRETISLCAWHHRIGPESHHVLGRNFWTRWGIDRDRLIAEFNRRYEMELGK